MCTVGSVRNRITRTIGSHPMVSLVAKGCGYLNPPEPKYDSTWDVSKVFRLFHQWGRNSKLSILKLSQKSTVLLLLCTAQRGQTIWKMHLSGMDSGMDKFWSFGCNTNSNIINPGVVS